jgi:hypothetical protein
MSCSFPLRHLTVALSPFRSILPFSFLHSTYYYCRLFFFFLFFFPLPIIICLTLSAEQDFFCYVVLSFTIFFMIFLPVGYPCPQFLKMNDAIGVIHTTQMYVYSNYFLMRFVTSEYISCSHCRTTVGPT